MPPPAKLLLSLLALVFVDVKSDVDAGLFYHSSLAPETIFLAAMALKDLQFKTSCYILHDA